MNDLSFFDLKKKGLEIGGPSPAYYVLYQTGISIDGINHQGNIWQGDINNQEYKNGGIQYIGDGLKLDPNITGYDFIIASHVLEHIANPLKALFHWKERIVSDGLICLVLPKKELCFDHRRSITPLATLIDKYNREIDETDLSSLDEILELHDLSMDLPAGTFEQFKKRSLDNYNNRCLHHHVFDLNLLESIAEFIGMDVVFKNINGIDQHIIFKNKSI